VSNSYRELGQYRLERWRGVSKKVQFAMYPLGSGPLQVLLGGLECKLLDLEGEGHRPGAHRGVIRRGEQCPAIGCGRWRRITTKMRSALFYTWARQVCTWPRFTDRQYGKRSPPNRTSRMVGDMMVGSGTSIAVPTDRLLRRRENWSFGCAC